MSPSPSPSTQAGGAPQRLLFPTARSGVRLSWHADRDQFVVSLWHDSECVASAPFTPTEAAEIASFIVTHLGERSTWGPRLVPAPATSATGRALLGSWVTKLRRTRRAGQQGPRWRPGTSTR